MKSSISHIPRRPEKVNLQLQTMLPKFLVQARSSCLRHPKPKGGPLPTLYQCEARSKASGAGKWGNSRFSSRYWLMEERVSCGSNLDGNVFLFLFHLYFYFLFWFDFLHSVHPSSFCYEVLKKGEIFPQCLGNVTFLTKCGWFEGFSFCLMYFLSLD